MSDERFATPMIVCNAAHVFVGDFVRYSTSSCRTIAKVKQFFKKVTCIVVTYIHRSCLLGRIPVIVFFLRITPLLLGMEAVYFISDEVTILDMNIESVVSPPSCISKWKSSSSSYKPLCPEVEVYVLCCSCINCVVYVIGTCIFHYSSSFEECSQRKSCCNGTSCFRHR